MEAMVSPVSRLAEAGEALPDAVRDAILALGAAAVPQLSAIVEDDELAAEGAPGGGWQPIHAARLLSEIGAVEAVEPMLRALGRTTPEDILYDSLIVGLPRFGGAVVEPALAMLAEAKDGELRDSLVCVLSEVGVHDERIYRGICEVFEDDVVLGSICFAEYGDRRALPLIGQAIRDFEADGGPYPLMGLADLADSYKRLNGGQLPAELEDRVAQLRRERDDAKLARAGRLPVRVVKVGRNDPCPCGSGNKYKKCCIDAPRG